AASVIGPAGLWGQIQAVALEAAGCTGLTGSVEGLQPRDRGCANHIRNHLNIGVLELFSKPKSFGPHFSACASTFSTRALEDGPYRRRAASRLTFFPRSTFP